MATKIVTKNSSTASAVPTASDLVQGELAVNVADKRLFTEDNAGAIVELGTNPSTLTVTGEITANGGIALGDNDKATFGAGDDLQIYHNGGSGNYIDSVNKDLYIRCNLDAGIAGGDILLQPKSGENSAIFKDNGAVDLYYDNVAKFSTTATGIDVTGTATMDGLSISNASGGNVAQFTNVSSADLNINLTSGVTLLTPSTGILAFGTVTTERMRIDSSGNVGIGVVPEAWTYFSPIQAKRSSFAGSDGQTGVGYNWYFDGAYKYIANDYALAYQQNASSGVHSWSTAASGTADASISWSEAMRIDSSGNVLVGKTAAAFGTAGVVLRGDSAEGLIQATRANNECIEVNRTGTDGAIAIFAKDGTAVGSIASRAGAVSTIILDPRTNGAGLTGSTNGLIPVNQTGSTADNHVDLGSSSSRFKDIFLSGAITAGAGISASPLVMSLATNNSNCDVTMQSANSSSVTRLRNGTNDFQVHTNGAERMRIDSSGNLLVGKTANDNTTVGGSIRAGESTFTAGNSRALTVGRNTNDGELIQFRKGTGSVGTIGTTNSFYVGQGDTGLGFFATDNLIFPADPTNVVRRDNAIDLGYSAGRFDDIYATNGTIQTSDRNEKQDIAELSDAEQRVAVAAKGLLRKFRWKDSVAEKGDEARTHFGIIAQDLQAAFAAEGLDAGDYAMFISSTWTDEETNEEKTRMGVRYSELLAFIIAAI